LPIDITNYVMLELGQPMHAFDADRVAGELVVRRATEGEKLTTLDGVTRVLSEEDMVICDDTGPISLAAVMGGQTSEVDPGRTNRVLFEAAHWDPAMVGRTARRHKLFSEAAKRWERGVDREVALVAIERATKLMIEHGGGHASKQILDLNYPTPRPAIVMASDRPSRLIGVEYSAERVAELLTEVGCAVLTEGDTLTVTPPSWRPDLLGPADLTEEVVRLDGFDAVPSALPIAPPGQGLTPGQRRVRSVGRTLAEQGYVEVLSYPFVSAEALSELGLPTDAVRLANPLSEEEPFMRTSLLPPLLATLRRNIGRGHRDVALFEQGLVFLPTGAGAPPAMGVADRPGDDEWARANASVPRQPWHVAVVLAGELDRSGWWGAGRAAAWSDAVQAARDVLGRGAARFRERGRRGEPVPPRPVRRDLGRRGRRGPRRRAAPGRLRRPRAAPAHVRHGARPRRGAAAGRDAGPGHLQLPARADRPGAGGAGRNAGAAVEAAIVDGAGAAAGGGAPVRRVHRGAGVVGVQVAGVQADLPRARPDADGRGGGGRPGRRGWRWRPSASAPRCAAPDPVPPAIMVVGCD
jgi:phenylalanyl-tRNA synthetase beta chain